MIKQVACEAWIEFIACAKYSKLETHKAKNT